jgi:Zn-dependent peptidase ImmA (M78 family)
LKTFNLYHIILAVVAFGCGGYEPLVYQVDARLERFVVMFHTEAESRGKIITKNNLIIRATPDLLRTEKRLAVTRGNSGDQILIEVDEDFIVLNDSLYLEFAMMHEFGHAFLKRDHSLNYSVMNPARKSLSGYRRNSEERAKLLDELFK